MRTEALRKILQSSVVNHKKEILNEPTIKDAHVYCKINNLNAQQYGPLLERYIKTTCNMRKNNSSNCTGDVCYLNQNIEIKVSMSHTKFNYVQIRANHMCDYLFTAYHLDNSNVDTMGELFMFMIKKEDIKKLIVTYGSYAHGTISKLGEITMDDLNNVNNTKEYALRPVYNSKLWLELLKFRIHTIGV